MDTEEQKMQKCEVVQRRIQSLDALRGFSIILMVIYHFLFNIAFLFPDAVNGLGSTGKAVFRFLTTAFNSPVMAVFHFLFMSVFIILAGISSRFSTNNLKRGLYVFGAGMLLSFVTCVLLPLYDQNLSGMKIYFGILHFMGLAILIWRLFGSLFNKIPDKAAWLLYLLLFGFTFPFQFFTYPIKGLFFLGFPSSSFASADYFPLFPWLFMFLFGTWIGKKIQAGAFPSWFYRIRIPFLAFVGRHTLIIYLLHQPVIYFLTVILLNSIVKAT